MVTIPKRSGGGPARRSRGAVSLSSADVPTATPTSDPGLRIPLQPTESVESAQGLDIGQVFAEGFQDIGETLSDVADDFAQVETKRQSRKAAVDLADKVSTFNKGATAELRRLNAEADLSQDDVLLEYGAFLAQQKQTMLDAHVQAGGTADSLARLAVRLNDIESRSVITSATLSAEIGLQKVTDRLDTDLSGLIADVQSDPTRLDDALGRFDARMDDFVPGLDEGPERALRQHGRNVLTSTAINRTLGAGDVTGAEQQLIAATRSGLLDADTTASLTSKITDARLQQNELLFKISQFEAITGRPANEVERLALLGVPQPQGASLNISIPTGYSPITDDAGRLVGLEVLPGGPVARDIDEDTRKREGEEQLAQEATSRKAATDALLVRDVDTSIELLKGMGALERTAGAVLPGSSAATLKSTLESIQGRLAFDNLMAIKRESGAGLGALSDNELRALSNLAGTLDRSIDGDVLRRNLLGIRNLATAADSGDVNRTRAELQKLLNGTGSQPNLPEGTVTNPDGTFTLPDGQRIRPKK